METIKTLDVENTVIDPVYQKQKETVAKMRASLLASADDNTISTRSVIQNITSLRVYHQLARIVKYLDMMDKLEDRIYQSIDYVLDSSLPSDTGSLTSLISIQAQLQKTMIESHKMLQPYLDLQEFTVVDLASDSTEDVESPIIASPDVRDRLRTNAKNIMKQLNGGDANAGN